MRILISLSVWMTRKLMCKNLYCGIIVIKLEDHDIKKCDFFSPNMGAKHCVLVKESNESVIGC